MTTKIYVLDTNVLIHAPDAMLCFEEHEVVLPMTVLEELDKLKVGQSAVAADCRQAIRTIDQLLGQANTQAIEQGVPLIRADGKPSGSIAIRRPPAKSDNFPLPSDINDNVIIHLLMSLKAEREDAEVVLISKDINMRLKTRACGIEAVDFRNDQLINDLDQLSSGYIEFEGSFWDQVEKVKTFHEGAETYYTLSADAFTDMPYVNQYILDEADFMGKVTATEGDQITLVHLSRQSLMEQQAWGLTPRDIYQAIALDMLLDPEIMLVNMTGAAGSGKTILALAAAIEQLAHQKLFRRIIATRSTRALDEDIGFLPGTEEEKMEPWLGAITDNLEALHENDDNPESSVDYILKKVPIQFKSLNFIRGRSFQYSLILIDEAQNLTPHQIKTLVTRAGTGSKVVCLGNLAQIDTPYINATSSGLTYITERFRGFAHGGCVQLQGVPRSVLAEYAETHL